MKTTHLYLLTLISIFLFSFVFSDGNRKYWRILEKGVQIESTFDVETESFNSKPVFSKKVKKIEKQTIQLKGFIIPLELTEIRWGLSKFEENHTLCCASNFNYTAIVEYDLKDSVKFSPGKPVTLKGTLRLNANDSDRHFYILENAICLDCE